MARRLALALALSALLAGEARAACPTTPNMGLFQCEYGEAGGLLGWIVKANANLDKLDLDFESPLSRSGTGVSLGTVPAAKGGTGQTSTTLGDTLYASGSSAWSKLAGNTTTTRKFQCQTGDGSASAAPTWCTVGVTDIPAGAISSLLKIDAGLCAEGESLLRGSSAWECAVIGDEAIAFDTTASAPAESTEIIKIECSGSGMACTEPSADVARIALSLFGTSPAAKLATKAAGSDPTTGNCASWGSGGALEDSGRSCTASLLPSIQTISGGGTVTANACGGVKRIDSLSGVTTSTTDTFTAPDSTNAGCVMNVCNIGANSVTLDNNANFKSTGAADVVLGEFDCVIVGSTGTSGYWFQMAPASAN